MEHVNYTYYWIIYCTTGFKNQEAIVKMLEELGFQKVADGKENLKEKVDNEKMLEELGIQTIGCKKCVDLCKYTTIIFPICYLACKSMYC